MSNRSERRWQALEFDVAEMNRSLRQRVSSVEPVHSHRLDNNNSYQIFASERFGETSDLARKARLSHGESAIRIDLDQRDLGLPWSINVN